MSLSTDFQVEIANTLAAQAASVREMVKTKLVEAEQKARADAVLAVVEKLTAANKALFKMKPDVVSYNADGTTAGEGYSQAKLDERKKALEEIAKLEKALAAAIAPAEGAKHDFSKVKELASK